MSSRPPDDAEWLEADGLGGFASGTVGGIRTRRYHALLLAATTPPTGRVVLVNGCEEWVTVDGRREALSAERYAPDVVHPDGARRIAAFTPEPWPQWTYRLDDGTLIEREVVVRHGTPLVLVAWRLVEPESAREPASRLAVKPEHLAFIKNALVGVNKEGTSAKAFKDAQYVSGGKTGTAQVFSLKGEKYTEHKVDERLRDHAWFIAYAPADRPKIALAVLVENGGFGAQAAAPIARKVIDRYLLGSTEPVRATRVGTAIRIDLPAVVADQPASVFAITTSRMP